MTELELRDYCLGVLENLIHTKGKQATDRKLKNYGYGFTSTGRGSERIYTITSLPDAQQRFKSFCVFSLKFPPQTDFKKLRDFIWYLMNDDDFNWRPAEMMEEYLRMEGHGMSRQTIAHSFDRLKELGLFIRSDNYVYYKVSKKFGVQVHTLIEKEEYCAGWRYYFDWRNSHPDEDSLPAFRSMYNRFGGIPRKEGRIETGAPWFMDTVNLLNKLVTEAITEEVSGEA